MITTVAIFLVNCNVKRFYIVTYESFLFFDLKKICFLCLCLLNDLTRRVGGIGGKNYLKIYI